MCGIAGLYHKNSFRPTQESLEKAQTALSHRGPDGTHVYQNDQVTFIHSRLSIIDVAGGDQPLFDKDSRVLVANGEIYNYIELWDQLTGYPFKTHSDCEVILPLYQQHSFDFAKHLRGMYGIALYDPLSTSLILARDPFGIKPLYYIETSEYIAFASEPQVLVNAGWCPRTPRPESITELLELRFTIGRDTIFEGIQRVMPGETLIIQNGAITQRVMHPALPQGNPLPCGDRQALEILDNALSDSVKVHLRSDVPYGLFLSGGADSATVLKLMTRHTNHPIRTFTTGFSGTKAHDERLAARRMAEAVGANHTEIDFNEEDFWTLLPQVAAAMDDPAVDYATLPTFKMAQVAKAHGLKVVLCGEGGDEILAGYRRYGRAKRPWWLGGRLKRVKGSFEKIENWSNPYSGWRQQMLDLRALPEHQDRSQLQVAQALDCAYWLPNDLLTKLDRCLMAHGLEGRTPFLDPVVAEVAFKFPDNVKFRRGKGKWILRNWLDQNFPAAEPFAKKRGFTVPVGEWIASSGRRLAPLMAKHPALQGLASSERIHKLFADLETNLDKHAGFAAWTLLFYALWYDVHIQGQPIAADVWQGLNCVI